MPNSETEEDLGAVESSLGIARLSMSKSGEVTVSPTSGMGMGNSNHKNNSHIGAGTNTSNVQMQMGMGIDKTDSILMKEQKEEEIKLTSAHDESVEIDLSSLRGIQPPAVKEQHTNTQHQTKEHHKMNHLGVGGGGGGVNGTGNDNQGRTNAENTKVKLQLNGEEVQDLEALSELVPGLKTGQVGAKAVSSSSPEDERGTAAVTADALSKMIPNLDSMVVHQGIDGEIDDGGDNGAAEVAKMFVLQEDGGDGEDSSDVTDDHLVANQSGGLSPTTNDLIQTYNAKPAIGGIGAESESSDDSKSTAAKTHSSRGENKHIKPTKVPAIPPLPNTVAQNQNRPNHNEIANTNTNTNNMQYPYSRNNNERPGLSTPPRPNDESMYGSTPRQGEYNPNSSNHSMSTETHTITTASQSQIRMPMYLPTFQPATGCTNASDFIVRCFVARLRSGITVVKHGRSRWCKSRLRILHVHSDGRSLSWKPAQGEPTSSKRPPKLDLSTCLEVRHAWSPDPLNPMFTGTPILRSKCEATNAFKSFALIFPRRTVDITAVTADQCKVLMEGFSALCFRLQVARVGREGNRGSRGTGVAMAADERDGRSGKEERGTAATTSTTQ